MIELSSGAGQALRRGGRHRSVFMRVIRPVVLNMHRIIGLVICLPLVILSISGSILVFRPEITKLINRGIVPTEGKATPGGIEAAISSVENLSQAPVQRVYIDGTHYMVRTWEKGEPITRWIADADGQAVTRVNEGPLGVLENLHTCMLGCDSRSGYVSFLGHGIYDHRLGSWILGFTALGLLLICLTGIWVWFRSTPKVKHRFTLPKFRNRVLWNRRLHILVATIALLPMLVWSITGAVWELPGAERVYYSIMQVPQKPKKSKKTDEHLAPAISVTEALAAAERTIPTATVTGLNLPDAKSTNYTVYMQEGNLDLWKHGDGYHANRRVSVDSQTGDSTITRGADAPLGRRLRDQWFGPIHYGWWAPWWVKVVWVFFALSPTILVVSGVYVWWKKRSVAARRRPVVQS